MVIFSGILFNLDGVPDSQNEVFDENSTVELPSHKVPVVFDFHHQPEFQLGRASLYFGPLNVSYVMELNECKMPKEALKDLYPCLFGFYKSRIDRGSTHIYISGISLSENRNADLRIKPIGEQK